MRPISAADYADKKSHKLFSDQDLLMGSQNWLEWLSNLQSISLLKGKGAWGFITGDRQRMLVERRQADSITQNDFMDKLITGNELALGYIRAAVHGNLEYLIRNAASPLAAIEHFSESP